MLKKILIIAHLGRYLKLFSSADAWVCKKMGYEVHFASNFNSEADKARKIDEEAFILHQVDFDRKPLSLNNYKAYKQLIKLMKENDFEFVHTQMAVAGVIGRVAAKKAKVMKVMHTAHGLNFFNGSSFISQVIYKPIEKIMSHYTDFIVVMNQEDFEFANKHLHLRNNGKAFLIHGIGVDIKKIKSFSSTRKEKRAELEISDDYCVFLSVGELIPRKNFLTSIEAFAKANLNNAIYIICGRGILDEQLKQLTSSLGVGNKVRFLGFRTDIKELVNAADVFLFPSKQEGLPVSIMEAMAAGLPCVVSNIRGNVDLIKNEVGGFVCDPFDQWEFADAISKLNEDVTLREKFRKNNLAEIEKYDIWRVVEEMTEIYEKIDKKGF